MGLHGDDDGHYCCEMKLPRQLRASAPLLIIFLCSVPANTRFVISESAEPASSPPSESSNTCDITHVQLSEEQQHLRKFCTGGNLIGSACVFTCDPGYALDGSSVLMCNDDTTWSDNMPTCKDSASYGCSRIITGRNLSMQCPDGNQIGSSCLFACDETLQLFGQENATCSSDGKWSSTPPICIEADFACPRLMDEIPDGGITCSLSNAPGSVCDYFCNEGYVINGPMRLLCTDGAKWSSESPSCIPKAVAAAECSETALENPTNGHMICTNGNKIDSFCSFRCDEGYGLVGETYSGCRANGTWSEAAPTCFEMRCSPASHAIPHGDVVCTSSNNIGSLCRFTCGKFHLLEGSEFVKCVGDAGFKSASWNAEAPTCVADPDKKSKAKREPVPFPPWLLCLAQRNRQSCLTRFLLLCYVTGSNCL